MNGRTFITPTIQIKSFISQITSNSIFNGIKGSLNLPEKLLENSKEYHMICLQMSSIKMAVLHLSFDIIMVNSDLISLSDGPIDGYKESICMILIRTLQWLFHNKIIIILEKNKYVDNQLSIFFSVIERTPLFFCLHP